MENKICQHEKYEIISEVREVKIGKWLQEGGFNLKIMAHLGLFIILFPSCLAINLVLYFSHRGKVINIVAQKNNE
jgi:hypothetical protein